jgi:hypothetical protein
MSEYPPPPQDPNQPNPYGQQNPYGQPQQPYGQQPPGYAGMDHPRGTTILVLGILSIVCCGIFTGIPAILMGKNALAEIDSAPGRYTNRSLVKAGFICGIIGTAWSALVIVFYVIALAAGIAIDS